MKKKNKKEENKWLKNVQSMSDQEILKQEKKLYIKYGLISGGGLISFIAFLVIFLLVASSM